MRKGNATREGYVSSKKSEKVVSGKNCYQEPCTKDVVVDKADTTKKRIRISMCAIQNNVAKIKGKHLIFKTNIVGIHIHLLIDNSSKAKLMDKLFIRSSTFQLEKLIQLMLGNSKVVQCLTKGCLVDVVIGNHYEQILCYLAKLDVYTVILSDRWLQMHNSATDWKDYTMKFNSANCIKKLFSKRKTMHWVCCRLQVETQNWIKQT